MQKELLAAVLILGVAFFAGSGCSDDDGGSDNDDSEVTATNETAVAGVVGVWALQEGTTYTGSTTWYITFNPSGTYAISDNADGSGQRVSGTYSVSGETVTGPFTNPGVGDGRIDGVFVGNDILVDFVEYWHSPEKHVFYAGVRL